MSDCNHESSLAFVYLLGVPYFITDVIASGYSFRFSIAYISYLEKVDIGRCYRNFNECQCVIECSPFAAELRLGGSQQRSKGICRHV